MNARQWWSERAVTLLIKMLCPNIGFLIYKVVQVHQLHNQMQGLPPEME